VSKYVHVQNTKQLHAHDRHQNVTETSGHRIWQKSTNTCNTQELWGRLEFNEVVQHVHHTRSLRMCCTLAVHYVLCRTHGIWCSIHRNGIDKMDFHRLFRHALAPITKWLQHRNCESGNSTHQSRLAGKSHLVYTDAAHWSSTPCAMQKTYTEEAWTNEALSPSFWHALDLIALAIHNDGWRKHSINNGIGRWNLFAMR